MENTRVRSTAAEARASLRYSHSSSCDICPSTYRYGIPSTTALRSLYPTLRPLNVSNSKRVQQVSSSSSRTSEFLLPRAPTALYQSEPGISTSPRVSGAAFRQRGGPANFRSPTGPQFLDTSIRSFLRAKYGGKRPGADGRRFPAACSVGLLPTSQDSQQQLGNLFCFENALRGVCSPCPVDRLQPSRHTALTQPCSFAPADTRVAAPAETPYYNFFGVDSTTGKMREIHTTCVASSKRLRALQHIDDITNRDAPLRETCQRGDCSSMPTVVRDSSTYCVVLKPPFWSCCCCAFDSDVRQQLRSHHTQESKLSLSSSSCPSVVHFLQSLFPQQRAPALYCREVRYGFVYLLDESWSGLLLVAKTLQTFEAFARQLEKGEIRVKFECLLATGQIQLSAHHCRHHWCRGSAQAPPVPPPRFQLCAPPYYRKTLFSREERKQGNEVHQHGSENGVQQADEALWHHVVLACCVHPTSPGRASLSPVEAGKEFSGATASFWKTGRKADSGAEGESVQPEPHHWRSFCHGTYLSFYECDVKGKKSDTARTTAVSVSKNPKADTEMRPLCTFEAALPSDLIVTLAQFQHESKFPEARQPLHRRRTKELLAFFREALSPPARFKVLAGCIVMISIGMAANTPWFCWKSAQWSWLQQGFRSSIVQAAHKLGSLALRGADACRGVLCNGTSVTNQLKEARYFVINILWGGSSCSLIDTALAASGMQ